MERILILGMGNSLACDDSIGLVITEKLKKIIKAPNIDLVTTEVSGLSLLDIMVGYDRAIVIDAIKTGRYKPGEIIHFRPDNYEYSRRSAGLHDVSLFQAIELGKMMSIKVPYNKIDIVAIEIINNIQVGETLSPQIKASIPKAIDTVVNVLRASPLKL